ncbi:type I-U CRISPR-associated protein Csx17 [Nannocystis sp. RBIL2]|uniref:type I-G CRISPR-associated protein Cas8g1/Csx17 n=1 Tax=Nannocystis sp. RBIL2 TaxID=2996788 RepID=UPI00226E43F0|nr:type I-U CRISPR-associated protein Csx17 [Nannocystis sp. RBIL2]MCY1071199.1 type I-U CRISPR-associated protein Csx17 [Nannocystis sp. RBIL2]
MPELYLDGCRPEPLAHYLKALGVLRLVAEQADPNARGCWRGDAFVLSTALPADALVEFFLQRYVPTPFVGPWNGGSGFYPSDQQSGIEALSTSTAARFGPYRDTLVAVRRVLDRLGLQQKPDKDAKKDLVEHLRSELPDPALDWLDAALVLTDAGLDFPPLLGTGGNDGRLEFSNNHMQRLAELLLAATVPFPAPLRAALFGEPTHGLLRDKAIGQFAPAQAGGANASPGFDRDSLVNPWDYILMLEGAVLFAAAATRKLESAGPDALTFPFTVRASSVGYGSASMTDEADTRDELWLPLWQHPAGLVELRALFSEGRAKVDLRRAGSLSSRPAVTGVDFARAVTNLGVARGIDSFVRYGFHVRNGLSYLATPLGRWRVPVRPSEHVDLLTPLDAWLSHLRRRATAKGAPASLRRASHRLEAALLDLCRSAAPSDVQAVLIALGDVEASLARARQHAEARPVPRLPALWIERADDGSLDFRLAAALAGAGLRARLVPVRGGAWTDADAARVVWTDADLVRNLHACLLRQEIEDGGTARGDDARSDATMGRLDDTRHPRRFAALGDLAAFIDGRTDDARLEALARGLSLLDWDSIPHRAPPGLRTPPPSSFALLALALRWCPPGQAPRRTPGLLTRACAGDLARAVELARRRLRGYGVAVPASEFIAAAPTRVAAALAFPLSHRALPELLSLLVPRHVRNLDLSPLEPTP